jgi:hypothetical protein
MKASFIRLFGVALLFATCPGCGFGGNVFRDSIDLMATPVVWLGNQSRTPNSNSPNSDEWTKSQWGPRK